MAKILKKWSNCEKIAKMVKKMAVKLSIIVLSNRVIYIYFAESLDEGNCLINCILKLYFQNQIYYCRPSKILFIYLYQVYYCHKVTNKPGLLARPQPLQRRCPKP